MAREKNDLVNKVYEEVNYRKFKILPGNRNINQALVNKITQSMIKNGWVGAPIVVNKHMEIIDGQHRREAARRALIPVRYMIESKDITVEVIQEINTTQKKWTEIDRIMSKAEMGNTNCKNFLALYNEFVKPKGHVLSTNAIIAVITGEYNAKSGIVTREDFEFPLEKVGECREKLHYIEECARAFKDAVKKTGRSDYFSNAVMFMIDHGANKKSLLKAIKSYPKQIRTIATLRDGVAMLEEIYNYNNRSKMRFISDFDREEDEKKRIKSKK